MSRRLSIVANEKLGGATHDCNSDTQKGARAVCSGARAPRTLLHGRAALRQR